MNILIAPDKFKGSITALEVCKAIASGLREISPEATINMVPMADGGEGTCDLLTDWYNGSVINLQVHGPLFAPVQAHYGISKEGDAAFIEMAAASGLMLLNSSEKNPLLTTTLGTGEMIADALARKVNKIILGLGGSATNDAGIGMASALGYTFCDADGEPLKPIGENLIHVHHIDYTERDSRLKGVQVVALYDVTNPLFGPDGAAFVYGKQKGADQQSIQLLDAGLRNFRRIVKKQLGIAVDFPGAGAAGGLGAGVKVFLNASMEKGINYIIGTTQLAEKIKNADLVFTGEGKVDSQTFSGKVVSEVSCLAREYNKPVIVVCGKSEVSEKDIQHHGIQKVISLIDENTDATTAMANASQLITRRIREAGNHVLEV